MLGEISWDWAGRHLSISHLPWNLNQSPEFGLHSGWGPDLPPGLHAGEAQPPHRERQPGSLLPNSGLGATGPTWAAARWSRTWLKSNKPRATAFHPFHSSSNLLLWRKSPLKAGVFLTPLLTLTSLSNRGLASASETSAGSQIWQEFNDIVLFSLCLFLWLPSIYGTRCCFSIYGGI